MAESDDALALIDKQTKGHYRASCHACGGTFDLARVNLFYGDDLPHEVEVLRQKIVTESRQRIKELKVRAARKIERVEAAARSVNIGFALERLAPAMDGFEFDRPSNLDARDSTVMFHPVDYVVFDGLQRRSVNRIVMLDRKAQSRAHADVQRNIEAVVRRHAFEWRTIRVSDDGAIEKNKSTGAKHRGVGSSSHRPQLQRSDSEMLQKLRRGVAKDGG